MKRNQELRGKLLSLGLRQWQLADEAGIHEKTLSIWLRHELTGERRERVLAALERIEKRGGAL